MCEPSDVLRSISSLMDAKDGVRNELVASLTLKTFHTDGDSALLGKLTERYDFEAFKRNEKEP